jgi:hypothetical protein
MNAEPIAYAGDAALWCPPCATARWPKCADGWIGCPDHAVPGRETPGAIFAWDSMPCHSACDGCDGALPGADCQPGGGCCPECDGWCRCVECDWRIAARARIVTRDGLPNRPGSGYRPTLRGDLWHALTGRTAPERGQLALGLLSPAVTGYGRAVRP